MTNLLPLLFAVFRMFNKYVLPKAYMVVIFPPSVQRGSYAFTLEYSSCIETPLCGNLLIIAHLGLNKFVRTFFTVSFASKILSKRALSIIAKAWSVGANTVKLFLDCDN